nr:MAG TPA: hypothetical protein [Caudoviricetes sp.]
MAVSLSSMLKRSFETSFTGDCLRLDGTLLAECCLTEVSAASQRSIRSRRNRFARSGNPFR